MSRMKKLREQRNLKVQDVAKQLGVTRITIWHYETGKRKPSFETLIKLAEIYGCTVNDFVPEEEETAAV